MKCSGKNDTTWNIPCCITFSPLHFMLYRGKWIPLGQCWMGDHRLFMRLFFHMKQYIVYCKISGAETQGFRYMLVGSKKKIGCNFFTNILKVCLCSPMHILHWMHIFICNIVNSHYFSIMAATIILEATRQISSSFIIYLLFIIFSWIISAIWSCIQLLSIFEHFRILWLEKFDFCMRNYGCVAPSWYFLPLL